MVEYGGNRPKIEVFTLADEMDVYHFDWSHSLVSIHAPAWGATDIGGEIGRINKVSIHAPAWGATALSGPNGNQWITYAFPRSY